MTGKFIQLSKGYKAQVDEDNFQFLSQYKWHVVFKRKGGKPYASRSYRQNGKTKNTTMHRLILKTSLHVDHIDGDTLNNKKSNLREVTNSQNHMNIFKTRCKKSSKFKGVCLKKDKWRATIKINGKTIELGLFKSETDAAEAYDKAAILHFKEFALTNKKMGLY